VRTKAAAARRISRMTMAGAPGVMDAPFTSARPHQDLNRQRPDRTILGPPASA
jgi:hypothetical protein